MHFHMGISGGPTTWDAQGKYARNKGIFLMATAPNSYWNILTILTFFESLHFGLHKRNFWSNEITLIIGV